MATYTAADIDHIEFSVDGGSTFVETGLHQADTVQVNEEPVTSSVNKGQTATAKKTVAFAAKFHDLAAAVMGAMQTAEKNFTEVIFKVVMLDTAKIIQTNPAMINMSRSLTVEENLYGYTVNQNYTVDRNTAPTTDTL